MMVTPNESVCMQSREVVVNERFAEGEEENDC